MEILKVEQLQKLGFEIFTSIGVPEEEAKIVADHLAEAELIGHSTHGISRIPGYSALVMHGDLKPGVGISIVKETPSTALIDGKWGFGQVVAMKAMKIAIEKANNLGTASVGIFNCHHVGMLSEFTKMAIDNDMIGMMFVRGGGTLCAPYGGRNRLITAAPISVAVPTGNTDPLVLDMAMCSALMHNLKTLSNKEENCSEGLILDKEGKPTNNPKEFFNGGSILPLGGQQLGYKGFGLSLIIEILGGLLTGAGPGVLWDISKAGSGAQHPGNGALLMAINVSAFTPVKQFKSIIDEYLRTIKSSNKAPGFKEIFIPGELEAKMRRIKLNEGISVDNPTWHEIIALVDKLKLDLKKIIHQT